jgi:DNA polymerase-3 subunit gamma/tau
MSDEEQLITKYRPTSFKEVIGQPLTVRSLQGAVEQNLSHCFLFSGEGGLGKTTLAGLTAALIADDTPPEFILVDGADATGVDDMRDVKKQLSFVSFKSRIKAVIVDECHRLSANAWDTLLRATENPPAHVYWFFCTTNPGKIPKTIRTRCLMYELQLVSSNELFDFLCGIDDKEELGVSDDVIHVCAKAAGGSPRQALANYAKCSTCKTRKEAAALLQSVVGADAPAIKLAQALVQGSLRWEALQPVLDTLKETNPEEIRQVVRAYVTKVILNTKNESKAQGMFKILDAFSEPFQPQDQFTPVVTAICKILFWE